MSLFMEKLRTLRKARNKANQAAGKLGLAKIKRIFGKWREQYTRK
jgi:hypothetical protein